MVGAGDRASPRAAALLRRLAVDAGEADTEDVLAGLVRLTGDRVMRDLQREARMAEREQRQGYADAIVWLKTRVEQLAERDTRGAAIGELLPWLIEHGEERSS